MSHAFFVEIVARNGDVKQRYPQSALPIRIGRAYDNDIILDDPHTAPHHAVIETTEDGGIIIRSLESRNGVVYRRERVQQQRLDGNTIVRLGHTNLRVRQRDFVVADELTDSTNHLWEGWPPLLAGLMLIMIQASFSHWIGQTGKTEWLDYLSAIATMIIGVVFWSGAWALVNHLFSSQLRFGRHLFIAASGIVVAELWTFLSVYLGYAYSLEFFSRYSAYANTIIIGIVLFFHLVTVMPRRRRQWGGATVLLTLGALGLSFIDSYQNTGRLASNLYMHDLLPPGLRQSRDHSVDEFVDQIQQMKDALDKAQQEEIDPDKLEEGADPKDQPQQEER